MTAARALADTYVLPILERLEVLPAPAPAAAAPAVSVPSVETTQATQAAAAPVHPSTAAASAGFPHGGLYRSLDVLRAVLRGLPQTVSSPMDTYRDVAGVDCVAAALEGGHGDEAEEVCARIILLLFLVFPL